MRFTNWKMCIGFSYFRSFGSSREILGRDDSTEASATRAENSSWHSHRVNEALSHIVVAKRLFAFPHEVAQRTKVDTTKYLILELPFNDRMAAWEKLQQRKSFTGYKRNSGIMSNWMRIPTQGCRPTQPSTRLGAKTRRYRRARPRGTGRPVPNVTK